MRQTQISITDEQSRPPANLTADRKISEAEARSLIESTAGLCADYPDWPEWLRFVRGGAADQRSRPDAG